MALALALGLQFFLPYSEPAAPGSLLAPRRPRLVVVPPLPEYPAILKAPVFAPDRHPGDASPDGPGGGALSAYAALGAVSGKTVATGVLSGPGGVTKTLRRGELVEGWRLVAVDSAKLTFERNGQKHVLVVGQPAEALSQSTAAPGPGAPANDQ